MIVVITAAKEAEWIESHRWGRYTGLLQEVATLNKLQNLEN